MANEFKTQHSFHSWDLCGRISCLLELFRLCQKVDRHSHLLSVNKITAAKFAVRVTDNDVERAIHCFGSVTIRVQENICEVRQDPTTTLDNVFQPIRELRPSRCVCGVRSVSEDSTSLFWHTRARNRCSSLAGNGQRNALITRVINLRHSLYTDQRGREFWRPTTSALAPGRWA